MSRSRNPNDFLGARVPKPLIIINGIFALVYFYVLAFLFPIGNRILFGFLIFGEVFHLWQLATLLYTVWEGKRTIAPDPTYYPPVDVCVTVAGEPVAIIEETLQGIKNMDYPDFKVYILNDGYVAQKDNWHEVELLADRYGATAITRQIGGGAKAGNINNGLKHSNSAYVAIFDADHVPHVDFLKKMMPYFSDEKVGFVQSPQYYKNYALNEVTGGSWEQQKLFFGPICEGKNRLNAATMCGTNMVIRRSALEMVGGMCEESIAEDFATGLFMHQHGWKSVYVPEVLAEGLAPEDFLSYYKQQLRWAQGALDVVFKYNVLFARGLTLAQRIQYLAGVSFFFSGIIVIMNALIPLIFFFTGAVPFVISTMLLAAVFLPYIFLTLYLLQVATNFSFTYRSLAFSLSSFSIHVNALWAALFGGKQTFEITSKKKLSGNFLHLVRPHIFYAALVVIGLGYALYRDGLTASVVANASWAFLNTVLFSEFIFAAMPESKVKRVADKSRKVANKIIHAPQKVLRVRA
jgi:cellulose synthase (UDP-forming)